MKKGLRHRQDVKPEAPAREVEDRSAPREQAVLGYDPYRGDWDRTAFGNGRFIPDVWEGEMPPIKRPGDDPKDYDYDNELGVRDGLE